MGTCWAISPHLPGCLLGCLPGCLLGYLSSPAWLLAWMPATPYLHDCLLAYPASLCLPSILSVRPTVLCFLVCTSAILLTETHLHTDHSLASNASHACASLACALLQGVLCGDCLFARYGEHVEEAAADESKRRAVTVALTSSLSGLD